MVDVQVNHNVLQISDSPLETTSLFLNSLADHVGVEINRVETDILPEGSPFVKVYDIEVITSGAQTGSFTHLNHKNVEVGPTVTSDQTVQDFFTVVAAGGKLHAVPRLLRDGKITYDIFYTNTVNGAITADLVIRQKIFPPGGGLPSFISTGQNVLDAVTVFREYRGASRVYDIFVLEGA